MKSGKVIFFLSAIGAILSCNKTRVSPPPVSINIVNAMVASQPIVPVFGDSLSITYFSITQSISYGSSLVYSPASDHFQLSIVQISDTAGAIYGGTFDTSPGSIYSFFLTGNVLKPDTLWVRDIIPSYNDSSAGVRFVNLSQGSSAISINLQGNIPRAE